MKSKSSFIYPALMFFLMAARSPLLGQTTNSGLPAGTGASPMAGPKIQFETPVYDFGKATWGEPVKYEYVFTNTGDALLIVSNVQPSCGCTTAGSWTREVAPQKTGIIPIQFNNTAYQGPVTKTIKVTSNDPSQPGVELQLKVNVWRSIVVTPQNAIFNLPPDLTSNTTRMLTIHNNTDQPLTLSTPELEASAFTTQIITNEPGKDFQLIVSTVQSLLGPERTQGQITIKTSFTNTPMLNILALAIRQLPVTISPAQIILTAVSTGKYLTSSLSIQNNSSEPLVLTEPSVNYTVATGSDEIGIDLKETVPGRQFSVMLIFPKGFESATNANLALSIKTSNPQFKVIKVPIKISPPPLTALPQPAQPSAAPTGKP